MKFPNRVIAKIAKAWSQIDPYSLRVRLTVGITAVYTLGLGSVAISTSWTMQQLLINSHKQNIDQIAERLPHDVELYSEMMPVEMGLQKAINNRSTANILILVKHPDGTIYAHSPVLNDLPYAVGEQQNNNSTTAAIISLTKMPNKPLVYQVNGRYWVFCSGELQVKKKKLGQLYVVQDITADQTMFLAIVRNLGIASLLSIAGITIAIALYVRRELQPLREISQLAGTISADDLAKARLQLDRAPSEVKELARTCNTMLSRLSESWEQQRQFVSNVSHELRTPLTVVSGYLQSTLRRGNNLTEAQREALTIASEEASRTIRLLKDLLDLARAESGRMHFQSEFFVLNDLVAEVAGMAKEYSERQIAIEIESFPIEVRADCNYLKQVLLNLIDNAVKYSEPDTPVTLKLYLQGEQAIIQVCDNGWGIPLQHQSRIFERFYRVDESRARLRSAHATQTTGGYGLGLAIVKTLVEGMGGTVWVHSQLGEGSVFTIALPAKALKPLQMIP